MDKFKIVLIGAGNLATHLCKALCDADIHLIYVHSLNINSAEKVAKPYNINFGNDIAEIPPANLYIFSVNDQGLEDLCKNNELKNIINDALCVHTAGSISHKILKSLSKNTGVFYPLQTFSKNRHVAFENIPIFIEADNKSNEITLKNIADKISSKVIIMPEKQRMQLHPAAVFACNFVNFNLLLAQEITQHYNIDFELLKPLIEETVNKALTNNPAKSQTGPAVRNDKKTLTTHKNLLKELPHLQKIYTFVSSSIQQHFETNKMDNFKEKLKDIKGFVFDVDGVFSDLMILHVGGDLMRHMNVKDGFAVKRAVSAGYKIGIITGGNSQSVRIRFEALGVKDVYLSSSNKSIDFDDFLAKHDLTENDILYMGDDLPDIPVMKRVALATSPSDAVEEVHGVSHYISDREGGKACVRDVIEQVMRAQGKW